MTNQLAPSIMKLILNRIFNIYNLKNLQEFVTERKGTVWYGLETLSYWYAQLWSLLPETLKEQFFTESKRAIRQWVCSDCVHVGCVKRIFKTLNFSVIKKHNICLCVYIYACVYISVYIHIKILRLYIFNFWNSLTRKGLTKKCFWSAICLMCIYKSKEETIQNHYLKRFWIATLFFVIL